jgi:hypothetical protein
MFWLRAAAGFLISLAFGGAAAEDRYGAVSTLPALDAGIAQRRATIDANQNIGCNNVGKLLALMVDIDQFGRFSLFAICPTLDPKCGKPVAERLLPIDSDNQKILKPIVARYSWHEMKACGGKDAQHNVWLLVQHSDQDRPFLRAVLAKMREAFLAGEVKGSEYAYLVDRVASGEKKAQTFGTQGTCDGDAWKLDPVLAPSGLDARRHEVGLGPEADYIADVASFCK